MSIYTSCDLQLQKAKVSRLDNMNDGCRKNGGHYLCCLVDSNVVWWIVDNQVAAFTLFRRVFLYYTDRIDEGNWRIREMQGNPRKRK